jgi:hypothetical protein
VLQNSLKSSFLHSQILCNFLGIFLQIFLPPESLYSFSNPILKLIFFYTFGFQPEQGIRPGLLPPFPAQPRPTSSLFQPKSAHPTQQATSALAPSKFTPLASENVKNQKATLTVFFLRKPDRVPPPPPRAPASPMTPPLPRQNELASLFLYPDSPFRLPISSPPERASPLKFH